MIHLDESFYSKILKIIWINHLNGAHFSTKQMSILIFHPDMAHLD